MAELPDRVQDDVEAPTVVREVLEQVVDHAVGSERSHQLDVPRVADRSDVRADLLGELDRRGARPRGPIPDHPHRT
jgi:hypothetical protein